ncbi:MAG: hypothetical protein J0H10_04760 [Alphaproteobacteria bacterium]|nr:hypothetical protein [Alphaproteobacteria bacterium]
MATTHLKITNAREYFDEIAFPDFGEANANPASLRYAFHCASSLYHLHEFVFAEHKSALNFKKARDFDRELCEKSGDFKLIRDIANTAKHMELDRDPQRITHIANTAVQSTSYGEGNYGAGPWGGGQRVRIHVGPNSYEEFSHVATKVMSMWQSMFAENGW